MEQKYEVYAAGLYERTGWKCNSKDEAIDWLKKAPFESGEVEIRQVFEAEDFGEEFTPELRAQEERIREQIGA